MACGTPVLATRRGSVPEVVDEGVTGFIREDLDGLVEAFAGIEGLDPRRIRAQASDRFDAPHMIEGYEKAYRAVVDTGHPTMEAERVPTPG
jgi:glycosyltransferase involved in cell wall biosynthesis